MIICIFTTSVLAKPLNNAQIVRGVFCLYTFEHGESYSLYKIPLQNSLNLQKISLICLNHEVHKSVIETKPYSTLIILVITDCLLMY